MSVVFTESSSWFTVESECNDGVENGELRGREPARSEPARSLERLKTEVLDRGLCVACGACVGWCPHIVFHDGQVAAPDPCGLSDGRCATVCPMIAQRTTGNIATDDEPLGRVLQIWHGRAPAAELAGKVQYGGVVTALIAHALETERVWEAVLTSAGRRGAPEGVRVRDRAGVLAAGRSIFAGGAALAQLNRALVETSEHPIAVVGLPCQCEAVAAMRTAGGSTEDTRSGTLAVDPGRVALVIGLFCTVNFTARGLRKVLAEAGVDGRVRFSDIPPPPARVFRVTTEDGTVDIPLDDVREAAAMPGCARCADLTAEAADISVGAAEGRAGVNTVIARSRYGLELVEEAAERGILELAEPDAFSDDWGKTSSISDSSIASRSLGAGRADSVSHLEWAALQKRERGQGERKKGKGR